MAGGKPTVEIVIRRAPMPSPLRAAGNLQRRQQVFQIRQRLAHAHHDDIAEPLFGRQQLCRRSICSMISPVVRFRSTPSKPLAQNTQPMPQPPAC